MRCVRGLFRSAGPWPAQARGAVFRRRLNKLLSLGLRKICYQAWHKTEFIGKSIFGRRPWFYLILSGPIPAPPFICAIINKENHIWVIVTIPICRTSVVT